ncbi:LPS translocon maturation chaperone LptM [Lampropedia aestuarii]
MHKTAKIVIRAAKPMGLAALILVALTACGQTGPLYMPNDTKSNVPLPADGSSGSGVLITLPEDGVQ